MTVGRVTRDQTLRAVVGDARLICSKALDHAVLLRLVNAGPLSAPQRERLPDLALAAAPSVRACARSASVSRLGAVTATEVTGTA